MWLFWLGRMAVFDYSLAVLVVAVLVDRPTRLPEILVQRCGRFGLMLNMKLAIGLQ